MMGDIRKKTKNWPRVRFGDVVRLNTERVTDPLASGIERYVGLEHLTPDDLHIHSWGKVADGTTFTNLFKPGQVLFGKRRAYQRKVAVAEFEGVCSGDIYVFETKDPNVLLPEILPFICQTEGFYQHAVSTSAGSLSPRTNWTQLAGYEIPLPPLDEQRRIAELLWAVERVIVMHRMAIDNARNVQKSLFDNEIEKEMENKVKVIRMGELFVQNPESGYSPVSVDSKTGHYVLILSALSADGYKKGFLKPVEFTADVEKTKLRKGDFLISRSNTTELVGFVGIFDEDRDDISFPDTMMRLSLDETMINKQFLELFLLSKRGRRQIQGFAAGTSGSMKKINRSHLSSLKIPLISLEKQRLVTKLNMDCSKVISNMEARITKAIGLKTTILKKTLDIGDV